MRVHDTCARRPGATCPPEEIAPHRAFNGAPGILRYNEAANRSRRCEALIGFEPVRDTQCDIGPVDRDAPPRSEHNPFGADRAVTPQFPKEDIGRILAAQSGACLRMRFIQSRIVIIVASERGITPRSTSSRPIGT